VTAKQRHREEAAELWLAEGDLVCILVGRPGHRCSARNPSELHCHHVIDAQHLTTLWNRARTMLRQGRSLPPHLRRLLEVDLEDLIADGRNSAFACEIAHRQIELGTQPLPYLPMAAAFAADFDLEHELPDWITEAAA
jgi:hypothetical protein